MRPIVLALTLILSPNFRCQIHVNRHLLELFHNAYAAVHKIRLQAMLQCSIVTRSKRDSANRTPPRTPAMITESRRELVQFLNEEANAVIVRACHIQGSGANALIEEAQELLALRTRLVERYAPRPGQDQLEFPFLKKAAA